MDKDDAVQLLQDWVTFPEAATILGVSNQAVHKMVFEQDPCPFTEVGRFSTKPLYLLKRVEVEEIAKKRQIKNPEKPVANRKLVSVDEVLVRKV